MTKPNRWSLALAALVSLALGTVAWAAEPAPTTITVPDMHCASCAKKLVAKLSEVAGVSKVQTDLDAKTATVTPMPRTVLSPRVLWEAVEKAGKQPTKLEGPGGTFTDKPKS